MDALCAWRYYTGVYFRAINEELRRKRMSRLISQLVRAIVQNIRDAGVPMKGIFYRGSAVPNTFTKGEIIVDYGFVSKSASQAIAETFRGGGVMFVIKYPKPIVQLALKSTAIWPIAEDMSREQEVITLPGEQFKVTKVKGYVVHLTHVGFSEITTDWIDDTIDEEIFSRLDEIFKQPFDSVSFENFGLPRSEFVHQAVILSLLRQGEFVPGCVAEGTGHGILYRVLRDKVGYKLIGDGIIDYGPHLVGLAARYHRELTLFLRHYIRDDFLSLIVDDLVNYIERQPRYTTEWFIEIPDNVEDLTSENVFREPGFMAKRLSQEKGKVEYHVSPPALHLQLIDQTNLYLMKPGELFDVVYNDHGRLHLKILATFLTEFPTFAPPKQEHRPNLPTEFLAYLQTFPDIEFLVLREIIILLLRDRKYIVLVDSKWVRTMIHGYVAFIKNEDAAKEIKRVWNDQKLVKEITAS